MSEPAQQSPQHHVSFNLSDHDDEADRFSNNYYAPLHHDLSPSEESEGSSSGAYGSSYPSEGKPTASTTALQRINDQYGGLSMSHTSEIIDQSRSHDTEKVVEVSGNQRYARLNTLLGKGAYKVVYKAIDREEGYEVAWNTMQVSTNKELLLVMHSWLIMSIGRAYSGKQRSRARNRDSKVRATSQHYCVPRRMVPKERVCVHHGAHDVRYTTRVHSETELAQHENREALVAADFERAGLFARLQSANHPPRYKVRQYLY